jgi:hypothetical protein
MAYGYFAKKKKKKDTSEAVLILISVTLARNNILTADLQLHETIISERWCKCQLTCVSHFKHIWAVKIDHSN